MKKEYSLTPSTSVQSVHREIAVFDYQKGNENIDHSVVESFGEEWKKFHRFSDKEIDTDAKKYFDIVTDEMLNRNSYAVDLGCGTGRWTKYLSEKAGFIEAIDPSEAIFAADKLIGPIPNVRLTKASIENTPFPDETFDFGMSIGVLHHIPNTEKALHDCVKKIKIGGYFYTYLYYNFENRGSAFKTLFQLVNGVRKITSRLPMRSKKFVCDVIAFTVYLPVVTVGRAMNAFGLKTLARKMPLSHYQTNSFFWMRTDALDRFGTTLEQRFSQEDIRKMMTDAGLIDIKISDQMPYWHAVGKRIR
ncbi:MAG: class I SAM-dependent methyltransferase [Gammaproteobacteria bacterium]|nr:MAG: class I SAM-dependent methyltransferase [Gammaproteobacteria bacterium]